jgi:hypothetical protein
MKANETVTAFTKIVDVPPYTRLLPFGDNMLISDISYWMLLDGETETLSTTPARSLGSVIFGDEIFFGEKHLYAYRPVAGEQVAPDPKIDITVNGVSVLNGHMSFSELLVGTEQSRTISITNYAQGTLTSDGISIQNISGQLTVDKAEAFAIEPNGSRTIKLTLQTDAAGAVESILSLTTNDPAHPVARVYARARVVDKYSSVLVIRPLGDLHEGAAPVNVEVWSTSASPVTIASLTPNATMEGNVLTILGPGPVHLTATQAETETRHAASAEVLFCVYPAKPTLSVFAYTRLVSSSLTNNEWYHNGIQLADAGDDTLRVSEVGDYFVRVNYDGCFTDSDPVTFDVITSAEDEAHAGIMIFPNPVRDKLFLEAPQSLGERDYEIHDITGRPVPFGSATESGKIYFDVAAQAPGIYFLRIRSHKGTSILKYRKR